MILIYNGIEMECLTLSQFDSEMIYDDSGTDYLYTKFNIQGTFIVNGQVSLNASTPVTSYAKNGSMETMAESWGRTAPPGFAGSLPAGSAPKEVGGRTYGGVGCIGGVYKFFPSAGLYATGSDQISIPTVIKSPSPTVTTATVIRQKLSQTRGRLFVVTGNGDPSRSDEVLLSSPAWTSHTDCKNGPTPTLLGITRFHGDAQTFVVTFAVETYLNESDAVFGSSSNPATPVTSPLLSNRFSMSHIIDEDSYLVIAVQGTAIFRTDFLYTDTPVSPDQFRGSVFLPVPWGCVREKIEINALPDATGFTYSYVDVQQHSSLVAGPLNNVTKMSAKHRQMIITDDDILDAGLRYYEGFVNRRANRAISKGDKGSPVLPAAPAPKGIRKKP